MTGISGSIFRRSSASRAQGKKHVLYNSSFAGCAIHEGVATILSEAQLLVTSPLHSFVRPEGGDVIVVRNAARPSLPSYK